MVFFSYRVEESGKAVEGCAATNKEHEPGGSYYLPSVEDTIQ